MATLNIEIDVPIQVGQMIYVDSVVGNDSTGTRGRFDKPYKTPAAAITAASAGDAVRVRPGTYVGNVVLKNGVNIITEPCVSFTKVADVINDYVFSDGGVAVTCSLTGNPKITLTEGASAAGGCIKLSHPSTNIYVELGDLIGDTTDTDICILVEAGYIHGRIESCRSTTYDNIWVATNDSRADLDVGVSFSGDHNIEVTGGVANISIMEATGGGVNLVTSNGDTTNVCIRIQRMNLTNGPCTFGTINNGTIIGSVSLGHCGAGGTSAIAGVPVGLTICDTRFYNAVDPIVLFYDTGYVSDGGRISNCYIDGTGYGISVPVSGTIHVISSETTIQVGANVSVEGDLFYDDGTDPSGKVATGNADGTWSWAAPSGGGAVDSVAGRTGDVVITASDLADFNTAALAAAPAETTTTTGALINGATAKTTPVDADFVGLMDSSASNILKKLSWANIKATLKAYFDTLYPNRTRVINTQVGTTYTLAATDDEGTTAMVRLNNGSAIALTFPENATVPIPVGFKARVKAVGAGQVTVTFAGATAVNSMGGAYKTAGQYAEFDVTKTATDTWAIDGNLTT